MSFECRIKYSASRKSCWTDLLVQEQETTVTVTLVSGELIFVHTGNRNNRNNRKLKWFFQLVVCVCNIVCKPINCICFVVVSLCVLSKQKYCSYSNFKNLLFTVYVCVEGWGDKDVIPSM